MRTINTIPPEEDAQRLAKACAQLRKTLNGLVWDAESLIRKAEDKGDEDEYLNQKYRERALDIAIDALTKSPEQLKRKKTDMKREIKFRAKAINDGYYKGEWVYGYYTKILQGGEFVDVMTDGAHEVPIQIDTIGQYTELKDKNGSDIWEGDIVMAESRDEEYDNLLVGMPFLIMFNYGEFCIAEDEESPWASISNLDILEVIGNIHDNPELLKGGEQ